MSVRSERAPNLSEETSATYWSRLNTPKSPLTITNLFNKITSETKVIILTMLSQFIANGLYISALYAISALGFGLIYNSTNIFHFAHGAVYTTTAYLIYLFFISLKIPVLPSIIVSLLLASLLGVLTDIFIYQPLQKRRKTSDDALMISSFGVYIFTINLIALLAGNETKILNPGVEKTFQFGNVILTRIQIISFIVFALIFALFLLWRKTKLGKVVIAFSNNPSLIEVLGWNPSQIRIIVFSLGSLLCAISSLLSAFDIGFDPYVGMNSLLVSAVAVIIGGVKIFEGAILGAFVIGLLQSLIVWQISARWMEAVVFILLIFFLLFRPQGLLSKKLRIEEIQ